MECARRRSQPIPSFGALSFVDFRRMARQVVCRRFLCHGAPIELLGLYHSIVSQAHDFSRVNLSATDRMKISKNGYALIVGS